MENMLNSLKKNDNKDYLSLINNINIRPFLASFFEPTCLGDIDDEVLEELVAAINEDVRRKVFDIEKYIDPNNVAQTIVSGYKKMNPVQLESRTHTLFLKIIREYFGESAYNLLCERKNINIFNFNEIHVLHQEIFDEFGPYFVNKILNYDLTPDSLIVVKDILTNEEKKKDFKYLFDFYIKYIGKSSLDYERMIRGYNNYRSLLRSLRTENVELTEERISALKEILKDVNNNDNIFDITCLDNFYVNKDKDYRINKNTANLYLTIGSVKDANLLLKYALFKNYFGMNYNNDSSKIFNALDLNPYSILKYYDFDEILNNENEVLNKYFDKEDLLLLKDMKKICELPDNSKETYNTLLAICKYYEENKTNKLGKRALKLLDKLPKAFGNEIKQTLLTVDKIEELSKEKGSMVKKTSELFVTAKGKMNIPVYKFEGADFAFISSTIYFNGGVGSYVGGSGIGNPAKSWFEAENGVSHISCSYCNQDKLCNLEFNNVFPMNGKKVTYIFDDPEILTMGVQDIYTPSKCRVASIYSNGGARFTTAKQFIEKSSDTIYNEVAINRFNYDGKDIAYGGKIMPSAILCCDEFKTVDLKTACDFTNYAIKHGLKPEGWQMPVVVVDKKTYLKLHQQKMLEKLNEERRLENEKKKTERSR